MSGSIIKLSNVRNESVIAKYIAGKSYTINIVGKYLLHQPMKKQSAKSIAANMCVILGFSFLTGAKQNYWLC
jgi:hypothetical protein